MALRELTAWRLTYMFEFSFLKFSCGPLAKFRTNLRSIFSRFHLKSNQVNWKFYLFKNICPWNSIWNYCRTKMTPLALLKNANIFYWFKSFFHIRVRKLIEIRLISVQNMQMIGNIKGLKFKICPTNQIFFLI